MHSQPSQREESWRGQTRSAVTRRKPAWLVLLKVLGLAFMVAFALVAGVSGFAQRDWWQNAFLAPSLASGALALRPWLPDAWSARLDFSPAAPAPVAPRATKKA